MQARKVSFDFCANTSPQRQQVNLCRGIQTHSLARRVCMVNSLLDFPLSNCGILPAVKCGRLFEIESVQHQT